LHHELFFVSSARTLSALDGQYVAAVLMFSFDSFLELVLVLAYNRTAIFFQCSLLRLIHQTAGRYDIGLMNIAFASFH
jgi:hypothetical protein